MAKLKTAKGSARSKAGLPAKAGRRRGFNIVSERDRDGKRQWMNASNAANSGRSKEKKDRDIMPEFVSSMLDEAQVRNRIKDVKANLSAFYRWDKEINARVRNLRHPAIAKELIAEMAASDQHKADPNFFKRVFHAFKMGYLSLDEIKKGHIHA